MLWLAILLLGSGVLASLDPARAGATKARLLLVLDLVLLGLAVALAIL